MNAAGGERSLGWPHPNELSCAVNVADEMCADGWGGTLCKGASVAKHPDIACRRHVAAQSAASRAKLGCFLLGGISGPENRVSTGAPAAVFGKAVLGGGTLQLAR